MNGFVLPPRLRLAMILWAGGILALPFCDLAHAQSPAAPTTQPAAPAQPPAPATPTAQQPATANQPPPAPQPAAPAQAQANAPGAAKAQKTMGTPAVVIDGDTADTLLGKPVESADGEDMGRIVDVIVDRAGTTRAAIIDFGGFLGVGSRQIAVDWRVLHFAKENMNRVVAELSRDQLRVAPVYKPGEPVVVVGRADAMPAQAAPPTAAAAAAVPTAGTTTAPPAPATPAAMPSTSPPTSPSATPPTSPSTAPPASAPTLPPAPATPVPAPNP
jgi:hypothetical protein